ncbi:Glutathione-regulated potassium-efflux system protein KefB [Rhodovastum atsumiense]|uniref:Glutathione-regulated potassium-efflux system protein KefB n=1 Tax=Rhodovastum atsumiense TaxID=504468 RepID=A0A5M6IVU8_9PROT|nr:monovalent cation:proton antiporter-2 (CPA2) family protein [Rhodovastum atsumiense]KAA5612059.1 glutathione-regulated potassium-efflux system protein KefB [Rhodovastum atsumiense]CAH2604073.1 Glutathione-regulated potassium-efflux system protein KefB [Rhodovastum atsumiense]
MLETLAALLAAAALAVPLSRRAGFGSVLGYLLAGIAIGPSGLRLVTDVEQIAHVAELGVVMLLFLIGLEVRPQRLWVMRRSVFGLGTAQLVLTGLAIAVLAHLAGFGWAGASVLGAGLALSSTAIVLPMLAERELLGSPAGRYGFAVLLFQDLAFIPLVALVPLLGGGTAVPDGVPWFEVARGVAAILVILAAGRFLMRPAFRAIGGARTPELFTTLALLTVVGAATIASAAGLSMSLGAFLAGVLLSESEYRHELQADIEPFEGLLLGFFFISVGMGTNLGLVAQAPLVFAGAVAGLLVVKTAVMFVLGRLARLDGSNALRFALALPQGSEFSFVLFTAAVGVGALARDVAEAATLVVALSMVATPLLFAASEAVLIPRLSRAQEPRYDAIDDGSAPVIVAGFGRVGQIVGRVLRMQGIRFTALERDPGQVEVVRRFGMKVYFGDPSRPDLLRAAGAETARVLVVALDDMEEALRVVEMARRTFPKLTILSRARNRRHVHLLMDRGIDGIVRDTFHSSLHLSELVLRAMDVPATRASRAVKLFRAHDERLLLQTHAIYRDEKALIQSTQQAAQELLDLFEADRPERQEQEGD